MSISISMCFLTSFDVYKAVVGDQVGLENFVPKFCLLVYFAMSILALCFGHISMSFALLMVF
jgi:hypothetical protein